MHTHTIAAAAALAFATYAKAQGTMIIINHCQKPVHVASTTWGKPFDFEKVLSSGEQYTEKYRINTNPLGGGVSLKVSFDDARSDIMQMEYTWTPNINTVWYDLSNINGQPFMPYGMDLVPSLDCCVRCTCPAGVSACPMAYFLPDDNWNSHKCVESIDLTLNLCVNKKSTYGDVKYPQGELPTVCSPQNGIDPAPAAGGSSPSSSPTPSTPSPSAAPASSSSSLPSSSSSAAASSGLGLGGIHLQENAAVSSTSTSPSTTSLSSSTTAAPSLSLLPGQSVISTSVYTQGQVAYEVVMIQQEVTVTSATSTVIVQSNPTPAVGRRHDHNKRHNMHRHHNRGN